MNLAKEHIKITLQSDMNKIINKLHTSKLNLLSFQLKEEDLNTKTGEKIITFLNELEQKNIKFKISKPLPRCLFGMGYVRIINKLDIPKDCYECNDLFTVVDEEIVSCELINKKGPKIFYMPERRQIWEYFDILKRKREPSKTCKSCLYFRRKQCICFIPK